MFAQQQQREHHFYVSIAKFLFRHPKYGIVSVRDPIRLRDAVRYDLSPLILYGLTVSGLPIRWMTFTSVERPRAFGEILQEAWRSAEGLRGQPDVLRVGRLLAEASPNLSENIAKIGVKLEVANAKEKSLPASLRSTQDSSRWISGKYAKNGQSPEEAVHALCRNAQSEHDFSIRHGYRSSQKSEEQIQQWLALPVRQVTSILTGGLDWEPGLWLSAWEASVPPDRPRYFNHDSIEGRSWLLLEEKASQDMHEDDDFSTDYGYDNAAEIAKNLIACWPNSPAEVAGAVGITLRQLQWFSSGKACLDRQKRFALEELLGIEYDEHMGRYTAVGPYVLIARKPHAFEDIYTEISDGGNACSCEIVPLQGAADPSWRYMLVNAHGKLPSILMAPRGEKITESLPNLMSNYDGIRPVSSNFYQDIVSTCARACREPIANLREMKNFAKCHEKQ